MLEDTLADLSQLAFEGTAIAEVDHGIALPETPLEPEPDVSRKVRKKHPPRADFKVERLTSISALDERAKKIAARSRAGKMLSIKLNLEDYMTVITMCEERNRTVSEIVRYLIRVGLKTERFDSSYDEPRAPFGFYEEQQRRYGGARGPTDRALPPGDVFREISVDDRERPAFGDAYRASVEADQKRTDAAAMRIPGMPASFGSPLPSRQSLEE